MKDGLADRLVTLFAQHWPEEAAELADRAAIEQIIDETADQLDAVIKRLHRRLTWARIDPLRPAQEEGHRADRAGGGATAAAVRRVHQLDRHLRPADLHADRPGGRGLPARLRRLRGRGHRLGPAWFRPAVRSTCLRPVPQQRGRPAGVRPRQPALRQPGHVLRRPLPPGGRRDGSHPHPAGRSREGLRHRTCRAMRPTARPGACRLTPCR